MIPHWVVPPSLPSLPPPPQSHLGHPAEDRTHKHQGTPGPCAGGRICPSYCDVIK